MTQFAIAAGGGDGDAPTIDESSPPMEEFPQDEFTGGAWMNDLNKWFAAVGGTSSSSTTSGTTPSNDLLRSSSSTHDNHVPPSPKSASMEQEEPSSGNVAVFFNAFLAASTHENRGKLRRRGIAIIDLMLEHLHQSKHLSPEKLHLYYSHISEQQMDKNETQAMMCKYLSPDQCTEVFRAKTGNEKSTLNRLWMHCKEAPPSELVLYLHNKGAFHSSSENEWLRNLHVRSLVNTDACYQGFVGGTDKNDGTTSSDKCNVCSARFSPLPHYHTSGNMWMAKCGYIRDLLEPHAFEEHMTELINTHVMLNKETLGEWHPHCLDPRVAEALALVTDAGCPAPWSVGMGRYAAEHWVHSHPSVKPCDVLPMVGNDSPATSFKWGYDFLPHNVRWLPELESAPRFPLEEYVSPGHVENKLQPITKWTRLQGRLFEWSYLYNATPPEDSWVWDYYKQEEERYLTQKEMDKKKYGKNKNKEEYYQELVNSIGS